MKKNILARFICVLLLELLIFSLEPTSEAEAASADITISSDRSDYSKGDNIGIYVDIESEVLPGEFEGYLVYPQDKLEYVSGNDIISGGEGILKISDKAVVPTRNSRRYSLKFKAIGTGECEVGFSDSPELYEFEEGYLMSVSVMGLKFDIASSKNLSNDTSLAVLKISPGVLEPEFSKDVKEYSTRVPISTEKLIVSAVAYAQNAEVEISGNTDLEYGNNRIVISVKAENGDVSKYIIICEREGTAEGITGKPLDRDENPVNGTENEQKLPGGQAEPAENHFGIKAQDDGQVIRLIIDKAYTVSQEEDLSEADRLILDGYQKTYLMIDGISIPVYTSLSDDHMLAALKNEFGEIALYSYDRTEKTFQRYRKKSDEKKANVLTESIEALELANSYEKSLSTLTLIIAVLCGLTMALLIVVIRISIKNKNDGLDD